MSIEEMRDFLVRMYPGSNRWADRVRKMPENQVYAIYMRAISKE